jgi:cytochrome c553
MHARVPAFAAGVLLATPIVALLSAQSAAPPPAAQISFDTDVQPVLEKHCLSCHGETMQSGRFDLRTRDSVLKGGARGGDVVPGDAAGSRLYRRIAGLERPAMPAQAEPLSANEIAAIKAWIDQGAMWGSATTLASTAKPSAAALAALETRANTPEERSYWAFKLPVQSALPTVENAALTTPIDRFL